MKHREAPTPAQGTKQTGLFDLFARSEESSGVVRHNLMDEEPAATEPEESEFTFKIAEPVMDFKPIVEERIIAPEPEPIVVGADDHKTDESIEEQLRKSRERIMRLKDLSIKQRSGNVIEMENTPRLQT